MTTKPKGHWPKGKRRNADRGDWGVVLLSLTALLDNHPKPGKISIRALADKLGCDPKTVWKWIKAVNRPEPETQERIATWVRQMREAVAREAAKGKQ